MRKLSTIGAIVLFLFGLGAGAVSAQGEDRCTQAGGVLDPATGRCVVKASVEIHISYPVELELPAAQFAVDTYFDELRGDFMDGFMESMPLYTSFAPWSLYVDYVIYSNPALPSVSIVFSISEYTGGAHPVSYYKTFVFNQANEMEVRLADLFAPGANPYAILAQVVPPKIAAYLGEYADQASIQMGTGEDPLNYQHFVLTPDALIFYFDQYQVAAGAAGPIEIAVPLAELSGILIPALQQ